MFGVLDELVKAGKLRHYGVSVEKVEEALKAIEYPGVQTVQIIFNIFRQRPAELFFPEAKRRKVGILARVPLASGLLSGKFTRDSQFAKDDHRNFNRHGEAFDRGETFSGVDFETGLRAVEELKAVGPQGRDPGATGVALDSGVSRRDLRHSRRETAGAGGGKHRGFRPEAVVQRRDEKNRRGLRRGDQAARASLLVKCRIWNMSCWEQGMEQQDVSENLAGKSTRQLGERWHTRRKIVGLSAIGLIFIVSALSVLYFLGNRTSMFQTGGLLLLCVSFLIMKAAERIAGPEMDRLFRREQRAHRGAVAEEKIGALLDGLAEIMRCSMTSHTGRGNIDHLVFRGDGAVFLIETKSHSGWITRQDDELRRNGQPLEKDFIRQTLDNVSWLKNCLKARTGFEPWIEAAIVFTDAHVEKHLSLKNVDVINARYLARWLERARGNPRASVFLWPQVENLKKELAAPDSIHLASQPLLR